MLGCDSSAGIKHQGGDESPVGREILYSNGNPHWHQPVKKPSATQAQAPVPTAPVKVTPAGMAATHLSLPTLATDGSRWKRVLSPSTLENRGLVSARDILGSTTEDGRGFGVFIHTCLSAIDWLEPGQPWPDDEYFGTLIRKNFPHADAAWVRESLAELRRMLQAVPVRGVFTRPANRPDLVLWRERAF
ncbi:MAG: hypothetical protein HC898_11645, partial [Phycisphaerales bacterium]|nr:hypothetical protein [Phycisphaerales bacterium]